MIEQLFGSKTRVKLLQLFYSNPNRSFYVREITRKIDEQINSVRRELANLLSIGIIVSENNNNKLYYEVDQDYEHYRPLKAIFGGTPAIKAAASKDDAKKAPDADAPEAAVVSKADLSLAKQLRTLGRVDVAILMGQFTRDERSGIDMLLVGDLNQTKANKFMAELEDQERKSINFAIMPTPEYAYRLQINDRFIGNVLASKKQVIINDQDLKVNL